MAKRTAIKTAEIKEIYSENSATFCVSTLFN